MKKIGFIYKYNPLEEKGILVYGIWGKTRMLRNIKTSAPVIFSNSDLLSKVFPGCLVYFELNDNRVSNIERASLANFKIDFINSIITCDNLGSNYSSYIANTIIAFERLENIIMPEKDSDEKTPHQRKRTRSWYRSKFANLLEDDAPLKPEEFNPKLINKTEVCLPKSINDLYNCFGKYMHRGNSRIILDVFDLSLWVDQDVLNDKYYGMNVEELKFLYDIFVMRKHYDQKGNVINYKPANDVISSNGLYFCQS